MTKGKPGFLDAQDTQTYTGLVIVPSNNQNLDHSSAHSLDRTPKFDPNLLKGMKTCRKTKCQSINRPVPPKPSDQPVTSNQPVIAESTVAAATISSTVLAPTASQMGTVTNVTLGVTNATLGATNVVAKTLSNGTLGPVLLWVLVILAILLIVMIIIAIVVCCKCDALCGMCTFKSNKDYTRGDPEAQIRPENIGVEISQAAVMYKNFPKTLENI